MIEPDWISPSRLRPLFYNDPAVVWLEHHGAKYGFLPDDSSYALIKLLEQKGKQFEAAWLSHYAPAAPNICGHTSGLADSDGFNRCQTLLEQKIPLIAQAPLMLPNQKLYGIADCLASSTWLLEHFPQLAPDLAGLPDHYLVIDLKFTSKLTTPSKKVDLAFYSAQVELYSYMLGHIQGYMPHIALLITRDQLIEPMVIRFAHNQSPQLSPPLKAYCEQYREIVLNHGQHLPWLHEALRPNYTHSNERWASAKQQIMQREPDGSVEQVWYIGAAARQELAAAEIYSLKQLLAADPNQLPKKALRRREPMLAILQANRSQQAHKPATALIAPAQYNFFVDCEFFSSVNVDFDREWPQLQGKPMIFMLGVGWQEQGVWHYRDFIASEEEFSAERQLLEDFCTFLAEKSLNQLEQCRLYHWSHAEKTATNNAINQHQLAADHPLCQLNWFDLERHVTSHCCAIPGAWNYSLKPFVQALSCYDSRFSTPWPNDLSDGATAQVMGWNAYQCPNPLESDEMVLLREYLEADCLGLYQVVKWLEG